MTALRGLRSAADDTGVALAGTASVLARLDLTADLLPTGAPGRVGDLAAAMQTQLATAVAARALEAAAHGARFGDAAQLLGVVAASYADIDAEARHRHREAAP